MVYIYFNDINDGILWYIMVYIYFNDINDGILWYIMVYINENYGILWFIFILMILMMVYCGLYLF